MFQHQHRTSIDHHRLGDDTPTVSYVVPVHNAAGHIAEVITRIGAAAVNGAEIIVVLDACTDGSRDQVERAARGLERDGSPITRVTIIESRAPLFETASDNIGAAHARAPFTIEVQADMFMDEPGFDQRFIDVLTQWDDLMLVSARACHRFPDPRKIYGSVMGRGRSRTHYLARRAAIRLSLGVIPAMQRRRTAIASDGPAPLVRGDLPDAAAFSRTGMAGWVDDYVGLPVDPALRNDARVWVSDTANRGPLAWRTDRFRAMGGFDERAFFLGYDTHDLMVRALRDHQWRAAFIPVGFHAPVDLGATRARRTARQEWEIASFAAERRAGWNASALLQLARGDIRVEIPSPEIRRMHPTAPPGTTRPSP